MPKDEETKNTKGYAFVEFNSPEASQQHAFFLLGCIKGGIAEERTIVLAAFSVLRRVICTSVSLQEAQAVRQAVNGFKLDKNHTFAVNLFDEIDRYMRVPDEYEPPENKSFQPTVSPAGLSPFVNL